MNDLTEVFEDFVKLFEAEQLPYVVMGGLAVRAYGIPRPTYDVDFTIAIERTKLPELYKVVQDAGYTVPEPYDSGWVDHVGGMPVVKFRFYHEGQAIDVDIFLAECDFQRELIRRRCKAEVEGAMAWLATAEDLVLLKLAANRPRDLIDVADILFISGEIDLKYMRHWARILGIHDALERALSQQDQ